ncbi:MAG: DoxX family protein, partial [Bacteroidia bacterium]
HALLIMRVTLALIFSAHAVTRIINETIPQFGGFLESKGFPAGNAIVWCITILEIVGGLMLALGFMQRLLAYLFIALLVAGIVLIHAQLGWWVGEHGDGGSEYSVALIAGLLVIAA